MTIIALPVDQRVIDIDSRRFASIEKALVELITNSDDSYSRLEQQGQETSGKILIKYERHQRGAVLTVCDQAEGMSFDRLHSVLSYGGPHSQMARGEVGGRGYFGRGLKQAVYGLGYGWIETIYRGMLARVDLFRDDKGVYLFDDWDHDRFALEKDYMRLGIPENGNGSLVTIVIDNPLVNIPYFRSLVKAICNNIYLRDIMQRRMVEIINLNQTGKKQTRMRLHYEEPEAEIMIGPDEQSTFKHGAQLYSFCLTLKKVMDVELTLKGDERTNGLLVISGTAVLDCQFFEFENQLGTEFLFGTVNCPGLAEMLAAGHPVISDEREGLNLKDPFVAAFARAVSAMVRDTIKSEQIRLSHVDHAVVSQRTKSMIERILQRMNQIAVEDLGIILSPGPRSGQSASFDPDRQPALRFSTPFYHRRPQQVFRVSILANRQQLIAQEILSFVYELPDSIMVQPLIEDLAVGDLPDHGRFQWTVRGMEIGAKGSIGVTSGPYSAFCEIVIAEDTSKHGYSQPSGKAPRPWDADNSTALFRGYELRNLDNDMDRVVYSIEERLILINTEAPTVRLYVDGQGRFKDGARLLLAELLLDVMTDELSRRYVDRSMQKGQSDIYRQGEQDLIRRYGVEVHSLLLKA